MNIFEHASKLKLRFTMNKGEVSTEELWDLPLTNLDTIAKTVNKKLKEEGSEESFIEKRTTKDKELELKLEVLKHIISVRLEEKEASKKKSERDAQVALLKNLLTEKKTEELKGLSSEEIIKKLEELTA